MRHPINAFLALLALGLFWFAPPAVAQRPFTGAAEVRQSLDRINTLGSVLMIAAHPDDENNALLVYLGRGKKYRTAYLSLTRGEGGQNLIGPEQGDEIGLIRTQELLAARRWDAGEQYFTRAIDFGFSKSADESMQKWGREAVLGDIVYVIRRYRPDVIINRFSGTARDGHGHHTASGLLAKEAYEAAGDPARFPEQLKFVQPWRAKRIMFNLFSFNRQMEEENAKNPAPKVEVESGAYDPVLGYSYGEIAGLSRSNHKSQAFGSAERRGPIPSHLITIAGEPATKDIFEGVDVTWNRVKDGAPIGDLLRGAAARFQPEKPHLILPALLAARQLAAKSADWWAQFKLREIDETIALCAGLHASLETDREQVTPNSSVKLTANVIERLPAGLRWTGLRFEGASGLSTPVPSAEPLPVNRVVTGSIDWTVPATQALSQPYWLRAPKKEALFTVQDMSLVGLPESPAVLTAVLEFTDQEGRRFELRRDAQYRFVDPVAGEQIRRLQVVPPVAVKLADAVMLYPDDKPRTVTVEVRANAPKSAGQLSLKLPDGWKATPAVQPFSIAARGELAAFTFQVAPPAWPGKATLEAVATMADGAVTSAGMETVRYPHIPPQTLFPPAAASLVKANVQISIKRVGYLMGPGDEVPAALRQLGLQVDLVSPEDVAAGDLSKYDALVTGVRAMSTRTDLRSSRARLLDYVAQGGTLIMQYNTAGGGGPGGSGVTDVPLAPYPLKINRDRVTVEEAPVRFPNPQHALLNSPNKITGEDFTGWVQERGLYYATGFDPKQYETLFAMNDPGEKESLGATVVARHGKGLYIYTSLAFFRQLPAGVPGAYRLFANFLSAGK